MPRTNPVALTHQGLTYEECYVREYKPREFGGPMPDKFRGGYTVDYAVSFEEIKKMKELLFGPTPILWDVLEYDPSPFLERGDSKIFIYEIYDSKWRTQIFRWNCVREVWVRIAKGPVVEETQCK